MSRTHWAYIMMAIGAVAALIFAAGPLGESSIVAGLFLVSLALLMGGAFLRRSGGRHAAISGDARDGIGQAGESLESLARALEELDFSTNLEMPKFYSNVQEKTDPPMNEFLRHRQTILDAVGFGLFAELMIGFSRVERSINRCLSAAADKNSCESIRCLATARVRMQPCLTSLRSIQKKIEKK